MLKADLTFTVELEPLEAEVVKMVLAGKSYQKIGAKLRRIGISPAQLRQGLHLENTLDLVRLTRDRKLTWRFLD